MRYAELLTDLSVLDSRMIQTYFLPAVSFFNNADVYSRSYQTQDSEEHRRLDLQHQIYTISLGGLYPIPQLVQRALLPRPETRTAIMDVGCGSGSW